MRKFPGGQIIGDRCEFTVWAPFSKKVEVVLPEDQKAFDLKPEPYGYWSAEVVNIGAGTRYLFRLDDGDAFPDPASLSQPGGVHNASEVIDLQYGWEDQDYRPPRLRDFVLYELHTGTFTSEGTFDSALLKLPHLRELGVTAIELMPVNAFPGERNWGYDGAYIFAVQAGYGGARGLQNFVNAAHKAGIAVILDVVYNHFGPEGNYIASFGPYFTDKYKTPWGKAVNFDDAYSDEVRNFFIQNALMWMRDFHIDGLRLDAIHAIKDFSARHFLRELADETEHFCRDNQRRHYLIAESDLNDTRIIKPASRGGYKLDAQWNDDFHHAIHAHVTGERDGYYKDFGGLEKLAKSYRHAFVYDGTYSPSRNRTYGNDAGEHGGEQFVVFSQNHDQIGNRMMGERLTQLVSYECLKLVAGTVFISPYIPLIFMGEEYAEQQPFQYFVNHGDADLIRAVREGRKHEFESFDWKGGVPDPQSEHTFERSKLSWPDGERHRMMFAYYRELISLKKGHPVISSHSRRQLETEANDNPDLLIIRRTAGKGRIIALLNFNSSPVSHVLHPGGGSFIKLLDSSHEQWGGPGETAARKVAGTSEIELQPESITIYDKENTE